MALHLITIFFVKVQKRGEKANKKSQDSSQNWIKEAKWQGKKGGKSKNPIIDD